MQSKAQIDQILRQKCEAKEIPGVVAMAATGSEVIYQGAFGKRDLSKDDAMTTDSVFWIASMTKAVTATARKIAVLFYNAIRYGMTYADPGANHYEQRYRERVIKGLHRRAAEFGFKLHCVEVAECVS